MKKIIASTGFAAAFAVYGLYQYFGFSNSIEYVAPQTSPTSVSVRPSSPTIHAQPPTPKTSPIFATQTKSSGQYIDGTYIGATENAYYGNVQVQVTISGGKISNVVFLQYPNDRSTSRFINGQAMPMLKSEAIKVQNAEVSTVSGASDTSAAFRQSLTSALVRAKA